MGTTSSRLEKPRHAGGAAAASLAGWLHGGGPCPSRGSAGAGRARPACFFAASRALCPDTYILKHFTARDILSFLFYITGRAQPPFIKLCVGSFFEEGNAANKIFVVKKRVLPLGR